MYFFHSDYLGSSSFITDVSGTPTEHLQYLPFGDLFVQQRATSDYYTPYKFTGKEEDEETNYSYFGARYYTPEFFNIWLSIDPMSDKYPNISPYNYCHWNPVRLIDPNGMDDTYYDSEGVKTKTIEHSWVFNLFVGDRNYINDKKGNSYRLTDQALGVVKSGTFKGFESDWETSKSKTGFNSLLKNATDPVGKENRLTYIKRESADGGNLDQKKNLDLHKIYGASGYAMDRNEAGNYVWGAALAKFGISTSDALFLANAGTLYLETINRPNKQGYGWSQWEIAYRLSKARLDEPDDQRAIELGSVKIWGFRLSK